ncbi:PREDICTED: coiled-coil domain-containing protein 103 [Nicrophorus vespilloides]|uniref:Coiled-coil domain-containing protein 103 n=1 Tax=Nicrophorus vespilloides TaxID=110193 RepID=A0ABM1N478_NICVS|nr:PREDICTED: coiled-coil domain-containing protein 103 [Nicrophorus vespilloides]
MSRTSREIDKKMLYAELKGAIASDKLYWVRNDAKIRASTTSKDYNEFRDIVAAAHLNPLEKQDRIGEAKSNWNKTTTRDLDS